jgi:hypothetical protein
MSRGFTSIIWVWNFDDEKKKVNCIYSLGNALEELISSQTQQAECSYDWIYDDLYRPFIREYETFLKEVLFYAPLDLQLSLSQISKTFDDLYEPEKEGFSQDIIEGVGWWNQIRNLSREALVQMEWEELLTYQDDLYYS